MYAKNEVLEVLGILVFGLFMAGCAGDTTPTIEPSKIVSTEVPPTQSKDSRLTATVEAGMAESTPHVSPYIQVSVEDVEIRFLETDPVRVELVIRGTLPDQCKYDFYAVENRAGQNVRISLAGIHPSDKNCSQVPQDIAYVLPLGRDRPEADRGFPPGDYTLTVNKYQTSFTIQ